MNKRVFLVGAICLVLIFPGYLMGCGQQGTGTSETPETSPSASITLSGTLSTGTISSAGIKASAAAAEYLVVAVDNASGKTYYAETDSSGSFSLSVPEGVSYEVSLVNSDSEYFGPVVMAGDTSSSEVVMGITPSSDTDLGAVVVDAAKGMAQPSTAPSGLNTDDKATATAGVPAGAGSDGKEATSTATRDTKDMDRDGIPDIFDADEDGDGIRDGIASVPSCATVVSDTVEAVSMTSNIWADHNTSSPAEDIIQMRLHVYPKAGRESEISSVQCVSVPATIRDVAIIWDAGSLGSPTGYPAENTLWNTVSYNLYQTTTLSSNHWTVLLIPKAIMNVGDTFTIRVNYTGGGYQDFFVTTSYVLTDWAKIVNYNSTTMPASAGTSTSPVTFSASSLNIEFSKPLDEDGNILTGLSYSIVAGTSEYDATAGRYLVSSDSTETPVTDTGASTLTTTVTTSATGGWYITPVAESADGQRNGEECWFKKE